MPTLKQVPSRIGDSNDAMFVHQATSDDLARPDLLSLSAERQQDEVQRLIREAHAARMRLIHTAIRSLLTWLRAAAMRSIAVVIRGCRAYAARRKLVRAAAELGAMSDGELKDIGVDRSSIDWVVAHGRNDRPTRAIAIARSVLLRSPASAKPSVDTEAPDAVRQKRRAA